MRGAEVEPVIGRFHLRASFTRADSLEVDDEEVQLEQKLPNVLVLPHSCLYLEYGRWVADALYIRGVLPDPVLNVFLDLKRTCILVSSL